MDDSKTGKDSHVLCKFDRPVDLTKKSGNKLEPKAAWEINFDLEDLPENRDPAFSESTYSSGSIDFSSGVYLYNERLSIGLSCVNMIQSSFDGEVLVQSNQTIGKASFGRNIQERKFFSLLSYNFDIINNDWQFEPILLIRNSSSYSSVYDFVSRIKYLKDNWFGLGYRSDGTTSLSFGVKANNLHIGCLLYTSDAADE